MKTKSFEKQPTIQLRFTRANDVWASRVAYFRLATFHGYLELCALCLWWVSAQRPQPPRPLRFTFVRSAARRVLSRDGRPGA